MAIFLLFLVILFVMNKNEKMRKIKLYFKLSLTKIKSIVIIIARKDISIFRVFAKMELCYGNHYTRKYFKSFARL